MESKYLLTRLEDRDAGPLGVFLRQKDISDLHKNTIPFWLKDPLVTVK